MGETDADRRYRERLALNETAQRAEARFAKMVHDQAVADANGTYDPEADWLATGMVRCDDCGARVKTRTLESLPPHGCTERWAVRRVHSVAILKGAVEGRPDKHLASLLAWDEHLAPLLAAGPVTGGQADWAVEPTDAGREFYRRHRLAELPPGRANAWTGKDADAAVAALDKLTEG